MMQSLGIFMIVLGCIKQSETTLHDQNIVQQKERYALFDKQAIDNEIVRHHEEFIGCYKPRHLKKSNGEGRITVKFVIAKDGTVYSAVAEKNTFDSQKVTLCFLDVFKDMLFPSGMQTDMQKDSAILPNGDRGIEISYPLLFTLE